VSFKTIGQAKVDTTITNVPVVYGKQLNPFIDSLKAKILFDTVKFRKHDLIHAKDEVYNKNHYSKLFIVKHLKNVNTLNTYSYKLDVVEPRKVAEFVNEYLDVKNIKAITIINEVDTTLYPNVPGILWIDLWDKAKVNLKVGGLVLTKKGDGSNFIKWKKSELRRN
jgi:hypothetical protein